MAKTATIPSPPPDVANVLNASPSITNSCLEDIRSLIYRVASGLPEVGPLTETLKWGQPSFLTNKTKSGTTIRLGWDETGNTVSLFVHCQTSLVGEWRALYEGELAFIGNREISIPTNTPLPRKTLQHCIAMALTYHSRKST
ncbi:MAG: DUF1801 domain-containing protein [Pseudomonadota bacterium]